MIDDEYEVVAVPSHRSPFKTLFILWLFIAVHWISISLFRYIGSWMAVFGYIVLMLVFGLVYSALRPPGNVFAEICSWGRKQYVIVEIMYWFVKSFLPSFRLEEVLIDD
jgi:hypothetical protein